MFHSPGTAASRILFNLTLIHSVIKRKIFLLSYLARGLGKKKIDRHQYAIKILARSKVQAFSTGISCSILKAMFLFLADYTQFSIPQSRQHTGLMYKAAAAATLRR